MSRKIYAADLFCGAGGTSTGLSQLAAALGHDLELVAVNHWDTALATHAANHPDARHFNDPIDKLKPHHAVPGGKLDLLWASPECTNHSRAKGGRPKDEQSRATAWDVLKWVQELYVRTVCIENVPELMDWGPLGADGKPMQSRKGDTFRAWLNALHSLGYRTEYKILNCADYGDATTRARFFLIGHRGRKPLAWPEPSHSGRGASDLFGQYQQWRTARDVIDWTNPGHSIFATREQARTHGIQIVRPLAGNTIKRIEAGIRKFWGAWAQPFLVMLNGGSYRDNALSLDAPLPTIVSGGGHVGLVQPFLLSQLSCGAPRGADSPLATICTAGAAQVVQPFMVRFNGSHLGKSDGDGRIHDLAFPLPVQDTSNRYGVIEPFIMATGQTGGGARVWSSLDPLSTVVTKDEHCVVEPFLVQFYGTGQAVRVGAPMNTITTHERFGLVRPMLMKINGADYLLDILFRMLTPAELAAAHSFPADYKFCGNKSDIVKQIGNSVPVATARALCGAAIAA